MTLTSINTRADLDALLGTPQHAVAMTMLGGTLWRLEKDDAAKSWTAVLDETTIERFGLTIADFTDVQSPELPTYIGIDNPRIAEIKAELSAIDMKSIRPTREGDAARLAALEAQAILLRAELSGL
ncbi:MAG: hypothetical protein Q8S71_03695 [Hydrogenophaga sp.]|nr:hypothetical protein [Hydrogenophaga sp.]